MIDRSDRGRSERWDAEQYAVDFDTAAALANVRVEPGRQSE